MEALINGRTAEEIKTALRWAAHDCNVMTCGECSFEATCRNCDESAIADDALALIERLEAAQPRWISVKERLPELPDREYCYVIVNTFLKGNANSAPMEYERTIVRGKREERWRWISGNLAYTPDFWMPLPEPPKEGA